MKRSTIIPTLIILITFFSTLLTAQVDEKEALMSLGDQNALSIDIENVNKKSLESYFKQYFKEYGKVKYNRKAKEFYINEANIKVISNKRLTVYAKAEDLNNAARMYLWVDNGSSFINSSTDEKEYEGGEEVLIDFSIFIKKSLIEDELKAAEKALSQSEKDYKQLQKDNEKYHKTIEDAQKKIEEMELSIDQNLKDQDNKANEIEIHKSGVEDIKEKLKNVGKSKI